MKRLTHSMTIGIAIIALAGFLATGCHHNGGLQSAKTDAATSDAAASLGGQTGSATGGTGGSVDADGLAETKGTGGMPGSGGATGGGNGGVDAAGNVPGPDGGATVDGAADVGPKGGSAPDALAPADAFITPDVKVVCPGVCEIYCAYGNVRDANGCPTCACNRAPSDCPGMKCAACPVGYENVRDDEGCLTCDCAPIPPLPCGQLLDIALCGPRIDCAWLTPGFCSAPALLREGCYDRAAIGCVADKDCSDGRSCVEVWIYPVGNGSCGANCGMSCGDALRICL